MTRSRDAHAWKGNVGTERLDSVVQSLREGSLSVQPDELDRSGRNPLPGTLLGRDCTLADRQPLTTAATRRSRHQTVPSFRAVSDGSKIRKPDTDAPRLHVFRPGGVG